MLSKAQKNWMIAIGIVSLVLGLIVALPFRSIPGLNNGENIFSTETAIKLIIGVVAILLAIYPSIKKYQQLYNYREVSKISLVMSYFPVVIYIIATIINIIQTLSFDYVSVGVAGVLSEKLLGIVVSALMVYLVFAVYALIRAYKIVMRFELKENIVLDVVVFLFALCFILLGWRINAVYSSAYGDIAEYKLGNPLIFFAYILLAVAFGITLKWLICVFKKDEQLIHYVGGDRNKYEIRQKEHHRAYNDILDDFEMYFDENSNDYAKLTIEEVNEENEANADAEAVIIQDDADDDLDDNKEVFIVEPTLEEIDTLDSQEVKALKSEKEEIAKVVAEKHAELNAIEEKQAALEEAKAELRKQRAAYEALLAEVQTMKLESVEVETQQVAAPSKKVKKIVPSFEKMVEYANSFSNHDGYRTLSNSKGNLIKYYIGKKMYLVMQSTNNDYRISFITSSNKFVEYLKARPGELIAPKNLKDNYWVKLTNKGKEDAKFMRKVIKEAVLTAEKQLADEAAAKQAQKKAKAAARAKERNALKKAQRENNK